MYRVYIDGILAHDPAESDPEKVLQGAQIKKSVNTADSFTFTIYPSNPAYNALQKLTSVVTVKKDDAILFHGRVLSDPSGWNNEKDVTCEGDLAYFCDTIIEPYSYSGTVLGYVQKLVNEHNAQTTADKQITIRNVTVTDPNDYITRSNQEYSTTMQEILGKLPGSALGGYIRTEYDEEEGKIFLDYLADSTDATNQKVTLAENLLDFQRLSKGEGIITALIPLGARDETTGERLTIESVNGGLKYITDQTAVQKYGLIYGTETWDDVTVAANLLAKAQARLTDLSAIIDTITVKAVDLSLSDPEIEGLGFFQYVTLQDQAHNASGQFLITERTFSLSNPQNDTLTFGGKVPTISGQTTKSLQQGEKIMNETTELVEYMTGLLTGSKGGYKVEILNEDGLPEKTLYMDTPDVETARQVLMISKDGIGFSSTGVNGPYTTAWTIGGGFNADFINAGTLQGIKINNGNGTFTVDENGNVTANSLTSNNATITGGTINIQTDSGTYNSIALAGYIDSTPVTNNLSAGSGYVMRTQSSGLRQIGYSFFGIFVDVGANFGSMVRRASLSEYGLRQKDATGTAIRSVLSTEELTFRNASGLITNQIAANAADNVVYLGMATSTSSYAAANVANIIQYRGFYLCTMRGQGKGVMASTFIPQAIAKLCNSDATCSWVYSAQNGQYNGQCYFKFNSDGSGTVYIKGSSAGGDARTYVYGLR